jgi:hypothetical protein
MPVDALYVDMMIKVYVNGFGGYIKSCVQYCKDYNFTEIEVFKSILDVYRPKKIEGVYNILNFDLHNLSQVLKQHSSDAQFVPIISSDFWSEVEYVFCNKIYYVSA